MDAKYHDSCAKQFDQYKFDKANNSYQKRKKKQESEPDNTPPAKRRSLSTSNYSANTIFCCFCKQIDTNENLRAAGTRFATATKVN